MMRQEYTDLMKPWTCDLCGGKLGEDELKTHETCLTEFINLQFDKIKEEERECYEFKQPDQVN